MDTRLTNTDAASRRATPADVADGLERERQFERLGFILSTLRVFLVLVVQCYLLLGFALLFVRPPSGAFTIAMFTLVLNTVLGAGCLRYACRTRSRMLALRDASQPVPPPGRQPPSRGPGV